MQTSPHSRKSENNLSIVRKDSDGRTIKDLHHYMNAVDIKNLFLRAAYDGDLLKIKKMYQSMLESDEDKEDQQNTLLLCFFLSIHAQHIKTAHFILKTQDQLRLLLSAIFQKVYDSDNSNFMDQKDLMDDESRKSPSSKGKPSSGKSDNSSQFTNSVKDYFAPGKTPQEQPVAKKIKGHKGSIKDMGLYGSAPVNPDKKGDKLDLSEESESMRSQTQKDESNNQDSTPRSESELPLVSEIKKKGLITIRNQKDMMRIKKMFKQPQAAKLMSRVIKIALNFKEDIMTAVIVASYTFELENAMIDYAVAEKQFLFLHNLFFYQKNTIVDYQDVEGLVSRDLNFEIMLKKVNQFCNNSQVEEIIGLVLGWKLNTEENILKILCDLDLEHIASRYMFVYTQYADFEFFFYCLTHVKDNFLKRALKESYFDVDFVHHDRVIQWALNSMKEGEKFLYIMNVLLYTDFRKWPISQISELVSIGQKIIFKNIEQNYLLVTYNPILALALYVEYMKSIIAHFNVFDAKCKVIVVRIKSLGNIIIENMMFEQVEEVFMEKDFKDRTVLSIISQNDIKPFIVKQKLRFLLNKIWDGKDSNLIDGKTSHFSKTRFLLTHMPRQLLGAKLNINDIIGQNFKRNSDEFNFGFQLKFRKQSILIIFMKDFVCASFLILMFQYINYLYLSLFQSKNFTFDPVDEAASLTIIETNLKTYKSVNFAGILLSLSYFLNFLCRVIFNTFSKVRLPMDLWMLFDIMAGVVNIGAFMIIGNATPASIYNENEKRFYDYYIIVVLIISWIRFFSYFLVVDTIGKITITLLRMIQETAYFLFIVISYFLLMATIFTTLFRNSDSTDPTAPDFSDFFDTLRDLFNYTTGNFGVVEMGNYSNSYGILYIVHTVISNIFLLNYLVAILQTAQNIMFKNGDFYSIQYQYVFISKYMQALEEKNGYDELILLPPPLNYLLLPLIMVSPSQEMMKKASMYFKQVIFWVENIFLIGGYFLYFILLSPYIYLKKAFLIVTKLKGFGTVMFLLIGWIFAGPLYLLFTNLVDTCVLISILCLQQNDAIDLNQEEKHRMDIYALVIYKDLDSAIRQMYEIAQGSANVLKKRETFQNFLNKKMTLSQKIKHSEKQIENAKVEDIFSVGKDAVFEVYKEISSSNKITKYYRGIMSKKSISSHTNFFLQLQSFSADISHKYAPSKLSLEFQNKVAEYFISNEKDASFFYPEGTEKTKRVFLNSKGGRIPRDEYLIISTFLNKFILTQKNANTANLDLDLAIKVLPKKLTLFNLHKIDLINFTQMQKSLIMFFNDDQDEMFNYYDDRLKFRLNSLKRKGNKNLDSIKSIYDLTKSAFDFIAWNEREEARFIKPSLSQNFEDQNGETKIVHNTNHENGEVVEQVQLENKIEKEIEQHHEARRPNIRQDHIFAPASFMSRLAASELPMIPTFYEDESMIRKLTKQNTLKDAKSFKQIEVGKSLQKLLGRKLTVHKSRKHPQDGNVPLNEEFFGLKDDQASSSATGQFSERNKKKKNQKGDKKKDQKKEKKHKEVNALEDESRASSDFNQFNYDGLKDDQNSTILSGKRAKIAKEIDFSDYSDQP